MLITDVLKLVNKRCNVQRWRGDEEEWHKRKEENSETNMHCCLLFFCKSILPIELSLKN